MIYLSGILQDTTKYLEENVHKYWDISVLVDIAKSTATTVFPVLLYDYKYMYITSCQW